MYLGGPIDLVLGEGRAVCVEPNDLVPQLDRLTSRVASVVIGTRIPGVVSSSEKRSVKLGM